MMTVQGEGGNKNRLCYTTGFVRIKETSYEFLATDLAENGTILAWIHRERRSQVCHIVFE